MSHKHSHRGRHGLKPCTALVENWQVTPKRRLIWREKIRIGRYGTPIKVNDLIS